MALSRPAAAVSMGDAHIENLGNTRQGILQAGGTPVLPDSLIY